MSIAFLFHLSINVFHCSLSVVFHLSPWLCPSTAGCSPPSMSFIVLCLLLSCFTSPSMYSIVLCLLCFTFRLGFVHPLQDVALHQCLSLSYVYCFPVSPFAEAMSIHCRMWPSINVVHCPLPVAFLFHFSPRLCPSTTGCSPPSMSSIVLCLLYFTIHLSPRLCPSTQDVAPPPSSTPINVFHCPLLLSCSRWFPPSWLCRLAIPYLLVPLISSLSLIALR